MQRHQDAKVKYFDVSNVIYHKFSHGAVSHTLNGKNVNVMLEFVINHVINARRAHYAPLCDDVGCKHLTSGDVRFKIVHL